jgi:hypothetical protein
MVSPVQSQYEERVAAASVVPVNELPLELNKSLNNRIISFEWTRGEAGSFPRTRRATDEQQTS